MLRRAAAVLGSLVLLVGMAACSFTIGAERIQARGAVLSGLNRETRQEPETAELERRIVTGLMEEANGETSLAEVYLRSKGYSGDEIAKRIAISRAYAAIYKAAGAK